MSQYADKSTNAGLGTLVMGMMLGGILTALFTPRRGEDVREFIKHRAQNMKKDAKDASQELKDTAENSEVLDDIDRAFK